MSAPAVIVESKISRRLNRVGLFIFLAILTAGSIYVALRLGADLSQVHTTYVFEFVLLGIALAIALGFEFVNGFHDTANAVATVIYTHSLEPNFAVVWSGVWNLLGVLTSSGAVAFGIVSLLPVELILQVGSRAGYAMVLALLAAAITWNLGTWYLGIPTSSSHTLIGSIIGVGLMNQLIAPQHTGTSGVDWSQAAGVLKSLVFSPIIGFICSGLLLQLLKRLVPSPELYAEPRNQEPPPFWIRGLLVTTCTGVSFAHGSNDGQKGMGLIMLILVGTVPTVYALNHAVGDRELRSFVEVSETTQRALATYEGGQSQAPADSKRELERFISSAKLAPATLPALRENIESIKTQVESYAGLARVPTEQTGNVRNDMYLASEAFRVIDKHKLLRFRQADRAAISNYEHELDRATKFIPAWVKVAVALALGLGTMVGWRRIVVTVGEKIGKQHLTYAQGAASEVVAMGTILAADVLGLPVSTTHVLTSGVAGTMAANHSGLQTSTLRNIALAWVLTLPVSIVLSGSLFWLFRQLL